VGRLLLGGDQLDPGLGHQFARRLLEVLEPLLVDVPDGLFVADLDVLLARADLSLPLTLGADLRIGPFYPSPSDHLVVGRARDAYPGPVVLTAPEVAARVLSQAHLRLFWQGA